MNEGIPDMTMREQAPQPDTNTAAVDKFLSMSNVAEGMSQEKLDAIGEEAYNGYKRDLESRGSWDRQVDEWVNLAGQVKNIKNFPWQGASNIKYPLLATAAMQFAARAYPALVPADGKIVQFRVIGADPQGQKAIIADKLAKHMNYQLLEDMADWEEEMDRLLIMLPIVGCLFKKTYFDPIRKKNVSRLVGAKDFVVNYWATSLDTAHRKTEILSLTKNQLKEYQNAGIYLEVELDEPSINPAFPMKSDIYGSAAPSAVDSATPYVALEQHTYLDLDDDGYQEPYIVTFEEKSRKVLRIVARFDSDGIIQDEAGKLVAIEPVEYYTKYGFIPNPDGGFYDIGFGHLLGPLNESANTLINQLVDAGTLANLQAGFIGKGLRIKMGETRFKPGEWKEVNATGEDLKKSILPLPAAAPSDVLLKLLGLVVESGKELASVAEIFTGKSPGQNTPATTTQATIEQGMKVFTAIYKRTYRGLSKEFKKLFRLNSLYEENFQKAQLVLDEPISPQDYNREAYDVCPTADPTAVSTTQKMMKAQMVGELIQLGTINIMEFTKRVLEAQEQPNIQALMQEPQPQQDPKVQQAQMKMQMEKEKHEMGKVEKQMELQFKQQEALMDQKFMAMEAQMKMQMEAMKFQAEAKRQVQKSQLDAMTGQMDMQSAQAQHQQQSQMQEEKHQMGMKQMKEKVSVQRDKQRVSRVEKKPGNSGSNAGGTGAN